MLEAQPLFQDLYLPDLKTWPIPYFGKVFEAEVLTVGVNPSCYEFAKGRWADISNPVEAQNRLLTYFDHKGGQHSWFAGWEAALNKIGYSYFSGDRQKHLAAHLDLSSRPTLPMSALPEERFIEMVKNDLPNFVSFLERAHQAKLLVMAGTVTPQYYLNQFLSEFLPKNGANVHGSFNPLNQRRRGKTIFQHCHPIGI